MKNKPNDLNFELEKREKKPLTPGEMHRKTDEIIANFKNGKERFKRSALFNRTVQMIVRGAPIYEVIDQLITITEDTQAAFKTYIERDTRPLHFRFDK